VQATRVGGVVALIGLLSQGTPSILPVLMHALTVRGIYVGSAEMLGRFAQAVAVSRLEPEVDRVFGFEDAPEAYGYFAQQRHVGKVVIRVA